MKSHVTVHVKLAAGWSVCEVVKYGKLPTGTYRKAAIKDMPINDSNQMNFLLLPVSVYTVYITRSYV